MSKSKGMSTQEKMDLLMSIDIDDLSAMDQFLMAMALAQFLDTIEPILKKYKKRKEEEVEPQLEKPSDAITRIILEALMKEATDGENQ